jgi:hypothetical protein
VDPGYETHCLLIKRESEISQHDNMFPEMICWIIGMKKDEKDTVCFEIHGNPQNPQR